jgi:hypothetical protein
MNYENMQKIIISRAYDKVRPSIILLNLAHSRCGYPGLWSLGIPGINNIHIRFHSIDLGRQMQHSLVWQVVINAEWVIYIK